MRTLKATLWRMLKLGCLSWSCKCKCVPVADVSPAIHSERIRVSSDQVYISDRQTPQEHHLHQTRMCYRTPSRSLSLPLPPSPPLPLPLSVPLSLPPLLHSRNPSPPLCLSWHTIMVRHQRCQARSGGLDQQYGARAGACVMFVLVPVRVRCTVFKEINRSRRLFARKDRLPSHAPACRQHVVP